MTQIVGEHRPPIIVTDASVFISFLRIDMTDLLADNSHAFLVTDHIAAKNTVRFPDRQLRFAAAHGPVPKPFVMHVIPWRTRCDHAQRVEDGIASARVRNAAGGMVGRVRTGKDASVRCIATPTASGINWGKDTGTGTRAGGGERSKPSGRRRHVASLTG